jgi:hypothetical protein
VGLDPDTAGCLDRAQFALCPTEASPKKACLFYGIYIFNSLGCSDAEIPQLASIGPVSVTRIEP